MHDAIAWCAWIEDISLQELRQVQDIYFDIFWVLHKCSTCKTMLLYGDAQIFMSTWIEGHLGWSILCLLDIHTYCSKRCGKQFKTLPIQGASKLPSTCKNWRQNKVMASVIFWCSQKYSPRMELSRNWKPKRILFMSSFGDVHTILCRHWWQTKHPYACSYSRCTYNSFLVLRGKRKWYLWLWDRCCHHRQRHRSKLCIFLMYTQLV